MSLRSVNLNLIPVLLALLKSRSVSRAAKSLSISQGAASSALSHLRHVFDDPLLIRVGVHMELTPRALDLIAPTEVICANLEEFLSRPRFDPATAERTFVIAASDYSSFLFSGALINTMILSAPKVRVRFVDVVDRLTERMVEREIDLAIVPQLSAAELQRSSLEFCPLFEETPVLMFRKGHPLAHHETVTRDNLSLYRAISFDQAHDDTSGGDRPNFLAGFDSEMIVSVPQTIVPPFLLVDTDFFSIVPRRIAERMIKILPLEIRPAPFASRKMQISLVWSRIHNADPAHTWFRDLITQVSGASVTAQSLSRATPGSMPGNGEQVSERVGSVLTGSIDF